MTIYEIFAWPWLAELGADSLAAVPAAAWGALAPPGVDVVWLMGVWERSPAGRAVALADPGVRAAIEAALPDAREEDVVGSAYCVRRYEVDGRLGGRAGLAAARAELARLGVRLLLDFVPNHVALDHPWVEERPELLVHGGPDELSADPASWIETAGGIVAHGRDPYFPAWTDVVQLNPFSPALRDAHVATLLDLAAQCDGVRCDMAMLFLDDVARSTWGERLGPAPPEPYWVEVIRRVRAERPDFLFVAEAYWDREPEVLAQGFDLAYDKRLYDALVHGDAGAVRERLRLDPALQARLVRFLENHDELRAAAALPPERLRAAASALVTLPGAILLHEGQLEGRRTRVPVQLGRRPAEPRDEEAAAFWRGLLARVAEEGVREGEWRLLETDGARLAWRWARHAVTLDCSGASWAAWIERVE